MILVPLVELAATFGLSHHTGRELVDIWKSDVGVDLEVVADWRNQPAITVENAAKAAKAMFEHRAAHSAKEQAYRQYIEDRRAKKTAAREALAREQHEEMIRLRRVRSEAAQAEADRKNAEALAELKRAQEAQRGVEFASFDPRVHRA